MDNHPRHTESLSLKIAAQKIQRGDFTSADIAAAKLAKSTGAYRPEDKDYIEALSKLPLPAK